MKKEKLVVKDSDESKSAEHNTAQDDVLEDAELGLIVEARKDQEEIEVDINKM